MSKHHSERHLKYRMATEVDSACGAILEELRRQDALDNTIVIFTTDNGNYHSEHGLAGKASVQFEFCNNEILHPARQVVPSPGIHTGAPDNKRSEDG